MRLLLAAATVSLLALTGVAEAQQRRDRGYAPRHHVQQRHHVQRHAAPRTRHHQHRVHRHNRGNNFAPWVAGAVGLGILGAIAAPWAAPSCYNVVVGYDRYGYEMYRRVCD